MLDRYLALTILLLGSAACSPRYNKQTAGSAAVVIGESEANADLTLQGVELTSKHDQVQVQFVVSTPRAMQLSYRVACPGGQRTGTIGENWESYRTRRLAELERERERQVQTKASLVGALVGQTGGQAQVQAGQAQVDVQGEVDGQALGQAVAEHASPAVELPAWERGAQLLKQTLHIGGGGPGRCVMRIWSSQKEQQLTGITGTISVVQLIDKARVRQEKRAVADKAAIGVRAELHASLIASGADPEQRARLRAETQRKEQEARSRQVATQHEEREARSRQAAIHNKKRERETRRRQKEERKKRKLRLAADAKFDLKLRAKRAEEARIAAERARITTDRARIGRAKASAALTTRARLQAWCVGNGADLGYRARQRQAEFNRQQHLQIEIDAKARLDAERRSAERLLVEAQVRQDFRTRATIVATLIAFGADPEYRRKKDEADLRAYEERAQEARYAQLRDHNSARAQASVHAEVSTPGESRVGSLVVRSSTPRPPQPATPKLVRPARPSTNASWIAGFHEWSAGAWIWVPGTWSVPPEQGAIWVPAVEINLSGSVVLQPGSWRTRSGRKVRRGTKRAR